LCSQVRIRSEIEFIIELGARERKENPLTFGGSMAAPFDLFVEGSLTDSC